jgi:hypothetical protein
MMDPYRYETAPRAAHASWQCRVVFNLYDEQGYWVARVAGDTLELAIVEARRHAVVRQMESALRAIRVNPEAAMALHDHPAWKAVRGALGFIDGPKVDTIDTVVDLTP